MSPQRHSGSARISKQIETIVVCTYINTLCYTVYGVKTKIYGCYVNFFMYCLNSKKICLHVLIPFTKHSIIELILISFSTGLFNLILLNMNLLQVKCQIANHMSSNTSGSSPHNTAKWKRLKQRQQSCWPCQVCKK